MRIDCAIEAPEAVTADVAIVGSGAAGQAAARRLLARGRSVVLLESGGLDHDEASADLNRGEVVGQPYHPLEHSRLRFFGGTTAIWGGRCAEFDAIDFERRDWVPHSGWPIGPDDIRSYLAEARAMLGVEAVDAGAAAAAAAAAAAVERGAGGALVELRSRVRPLHHRPGRATWKQRSALHLADPCHGPRNDAGRRQGLGRAARRAHAVAAGRSTSARAITSWPPAGSRIRASCSPPTRSCRTASAITTTWSAAISWSIPTPAAAGSSARPIGAGCRPSPSAGSTASRCRRRSRRPRRCSGAKGCSTPR